MSLHAELFCIIIIVHAIYTDTAPTDIVVTVICSNNTDNPDVQVKWNVSQLSWL